MFIKKLMEKGLTKGVQILSGQGKTTGKEGIKNIKIAPNIDTKKAIEQKLLKRLIKLLKMQMYHQVLEINK